MNLVFTVQLCCVLAAPGEITLKFNDKKEKKYSTAGRIFAASEMLKGSVRHGETMRGRKGELPFSQGTFDMLAWMLEDDAEDTADMGICPLYPLMRAADFLGLARGELVLICRRLASKGLRGRQKEKILRTEMERDNGLEPSSRFALVLLREFVGASGVDVCVEGGTATLCYAGDGRYGSNEEIAAVGRVCIVPSALRLLLDGGVPAGPSARTGADAGGGPGGVGAWLGSVLYRLIGMWRAGEQPAAMSQGARGGEDGTNKSTAWDVIIWILRSMEVSGLDLSGCAVSGGQICSLCRLAELRVLSLSCCNLQKESLLSIGALGRLEELDVGYTMLSGKDVEAVLSCRKLKRLILRRCALREGSLAGVGDLSGLVELDIAGCWLGDRDITAITSLKRLKKLCMYCCQARRNRLGSIGLLRGLRELDVGENDLGDGDIAAIGSLAELERLRMGKCMLSEKNLGPLRNLARLIELDVGRNNICGRVAPILSLRRLERLNVGACSLGPCDLLGVGGLADLEWLDVSCSRLGQDVVAEILSLGKLKKLSMESCRLEAGVLLGIDRLESLEEMNVANVVLGEGEVAGMLRLRRLVVASCGLKRDSLLAIGGVWTLESLDAGRNHLLGAGDVAAIAGLPRLRKLSLAGTYLKLGDLQAVGRLRYCLEELDVGTCDLGNDDDVREIGRLSRLRRLGMSGCGLRQGALRLLGGLGSLSALNVGGGVLSDGDIWVIVSFASLRELTVFYCKMSDENRKRLRGLASLERLWEGKVS